MKLPVCIANFFYGFVTGLALLALWVVMRLLQGARF